MTTDMDGIAEKSLQRACPASQLGNELCSEEDTKKEHDDISYVTDLYGVVIRLWL